MLALFITSCYYDKEGVLYPEAACDQTASATFTAVVLPLMNAQCNSCHAGAFASGGIKLDSYTETKKYVDNGKLIGSITHASGYSPMPQGGGSMSSCDIAKIQTWIKAGALNN